MRTKTRMIMPSSVRRRAGRCHVVASASALAPALGSPHAGLVRRAWPRSSVLTGVVTWCGDGGPGGGQCGDVVVTVVAVRPWVLPARRRFAVPLGFLFSRPPGWRCTGGPGPGKAPPGRLQGLEVGRRARRTACQRGALDQCWLEPEHPTGPPLEDGDAVLERATK